MGICEGKWVEGGLFFIPILLNLNLANYSNYSTLLEHKKDKIKIVVDHYAAHHLTWDPNEKQSAYRIFATV